MPPSLLDVLGQEQNRDIAENPWYNAGQDTLNTRLPYMPFQGIRGALPILAQQLAGTFARNQGIRQIEETRQNRLSALSDALGAPPVYDPSVANPLVAYQQALMKYKQDAQDNLSNNPLTSPLAASLAGQGADNTVASGSAFNNALAMTGVKFAPYGSIFGGGGQGGNASQAPQATSSIAPSAGGPSDAGASAPGGATLASTLQDPAAARQVGEQLIAASRPGGPSFNSAMNTVTGGTGAQSLPELEKKMAVTKEGSAIQSQAIQAAKAQREFEKLQSAAGNLPDKAKEQFTGGVQFINELRRIQKEDIPAAQKEIADYAKRNNITDPTAIDYLERAARHVSFGKTSSNLMKNALESAANEQSKSKFGRLTLFDTPQEAEQLSGNGILSLKDVNSNIDRATRRAMVGLKAIVQSGKELDRNTLASLHPEVFDPGAPVSGAASTPPPPLPGESQANYIARLGGK